jgi:hypothetical protein
MMNVSNNNTPQWMMSYNECMDENYLKPANREIDMSQVDFNAYIDDAIAYIFNDN